ncbi:tripeptidyl-peptidase II Tpp2 [Stylosanthes scabra]|uniref:Tripeptidyl-peptidase II Tpp2 n=1 Tax=Stylosanthes scabra TaxID=79078 RepID=A0ABU6TS95_9FABA|nr:tripeptidyl-peptidase II Tpp2 [Stylosanthes scabra]
MPCSSSLTSCCASAHSSINTNIENDDNNNNGATPRNLKLNESSFLSSLMPKKEIGVDRFLHAHPSYDGRGALIAIFDSGVDPAAAGLQVTSDGKPKILDVLDCTGSGDVDTSKVVKADADGCISGASGASLVINASWKNPSGEWHVGYKFVYELFTEKLTSRLKKERKKKWDKKNQEEIAKAVKQLDDFDQQHAKIEDAELKKAREDLQNRVDLLRKQSESYDDKGPVIDVVVWHDGEVWRVALDTQSIEDDPDCGKLANFVPLTNYRIERKYGVFSKLDACTFVVNVYNDGKVVSIVTDSSPHGTHVAGIATAFHPEEPLLNGVAPGAQLISCKIGDSRLGSMETGTGLTRALIAAVEHKCDLINMSYGEPTLLPDYGRFVDLVNEVSSETLILTVPAVSFC